MGKPGAKKMDQIVSVTPGDVHIIMIPSPGGPVPTPIPHPCASMIKDKVATKVKVMGQPGAVKGSKSKHTPPHIPMGPGPFQKPPKNEGEIITGSANVFYEGKEAAMLGDTGQMCSDPSDTPVGKVIGTAATVLVGGGGSDGGEDGSGDGSGKKAGGAASGALGDTTGTGHPVDVATGNLIVSGDDFGLDGPLPIQFVRTYVSARATTPGPMGFGWMHNFQESVELVLEGDSEWQRIHQELTEAGNPAPDRNYAIYRDPNGLASSYRLPREGEELIDEFHRRRFRRDGTLFSITSRQGIISRFGRITENSNKLQLIEVVDRNGNKNLFRYTSEELLSEVEDCYGRALLLVYENQQVSEIRLRVSPQELAKCWCRYKYDAAGDLVEVIDGAGFSTRFTYADHLIVQDISHGGHSFFFAYDPNRRCIRTWGQDGYLTRFLSYDLEKRRTHEINGEGEQTIHYYTPAGVVWRTERGRELTTELTFDDAGRTLNCFNGGQITVAYEYDADGNAISVTDGEGNATTLKYNPFGQVILIAKPIGLQTNFEYDERGNMIARTDQDGDITRYVYDKLGRPIRETQPNGTLVERAYDAFGHESCVTIDGVLTAYRYDPIGNLLSEAPPDLPATTIEWNERGFPSCVRVGGVLNASFEYDREGFIAAVTDPQQARREYRFGPPGVPVEVAEYDAPQGGPKAIRSRLSITIDREGRPILTKDLTGDVCRFEYDDAGRLIRDGRRERSVEFGYNGSDLAKSIGTNLGPPIRFEHDGRGLVTRIEYSDDHQDVFEYDELSRLVSGSNNWGSVTCEYDETGAKARRSQGSFEVNLELDKTTGKVRLTLGDEVSAEFLPDSSGRLGSVAFAGKRIEFASDETGHVCERRFPNDITERCVYGGRGRISEVQLTRGDLLFNRRILEPGLEGRLAAISDGLRGNRQFEYDARGRLVRVRGAADEWYRYGERDNLVACHRFSSADISNPDLLFRAGERHYTYDSWQRVSSLVDPKHGVFRFHYDAKGQLDCVELPDSGRAHYRYDVFGRRTEKRFEGGLRAGRKVLFCWDEQQLAKEEVWLGEERQCEWYYLYLKEQPLARLERRNDREQIIFYHNDHAGAPLLCTDEGGEVVWQSRGDSFGYQAEDGPAFQNLRLPGQYYDEETGLHYNRYRYFDPFASRYLQPDPVAAFSEPNRFSYPTDPHSCIDPLGLSTVVLTADPSDAVLQAGSAATSKAAGVNVTDLFGTEKFNGSVDKVIIHAHGSPDRIDVSTPWRRLVGKLPFVSKTRSMSGKELAQLLKKKGLKPNQVVLASCEVGREKGTFAKEFAEEMGRGDDGNKNIKVTAWAGYVTVLKNGTFRMTSDTITKSSDPDWSQYKWYTRWYHKMKHTPVYTAVPEKPGVGQFTYDAQGKRSPAV